MMKFSLCLVCGMIFIMLAPALALSALRRMKAAGTNVHPSEPALTIVRAGPFLFTRNPMYLALCLLQVALGFFLNDWITLLFVVPLVLIFHYGVVLREERYLTAKFGEPYLQYKREVRRWICLARDLCADRLDRKGDNHGNGRSTNAGQHDFWRNPGAPR